MSVKLLPFSGQSHIHWLWIGTWSMAGMGFGPHDERESLRVLERACSEGITHFDTANIYGRGMAESLLAKLIKRRRERLFIATKGGLIYKGKRVIHSASPESLRAQLQESLKRLGTDYIDLYQLHWPDPKVPLEESLNSLQKFKEEGLIRYWGVCNLKSAEIEKHLSQERGIPHQIHFNPLHRDYDTIEASKRYCINIITSPFEQGLLTGSSFKGLTRRDLRRKNPYFRDEVVLKRIRELRRVAEREDFPLSVAVLLWIGSTDGVGAIVPGPRRVEQLEELLGCIRVVEQNNLLQKAGDRLFNPDKVASAVPEPLWDALFIFS